VGTSVFGTANIAVVLVNSSDMGSSALGTRKESFGAFAVGNGVTEAEASATLEEGGTILEGADRGLAAEEIGRRAFHELEAIAIGVVEGEYDAGVNFAGQVFFAAEPSWFRKNAMSSTNSVFHEFGTEGGGRDRVPVSISDDWYPA
jgi:hypothetical protein